MKRVGLVTYAAIPELTDDDNLTVRELQQSGISVTPMVWDDPAALTLPVDAVILRSCWDYHLKAREFASWVRERESFGPVLNPAATVEWNLNKRYLRELAGRGVTIPPTAWVESGGARLYDMLDTNGWDEAVVKPMISLSAYQTWRTSKEKAPQDEARFQSLCASGPVMVQSFLPEILVYGELSLVFFDRKFSHAVRKVPKPGDFRVQEEFGARRLPCEATTSEVRWANHILDGISGRLLYARVDGVPVGGEMVLMELELIDPFLFLATEPAAPRRFADAIRRCLA